MPAAIIFYGNGHLTTSEHRKPVDYLPKAKANGERGSAISYRRGNFVVIFFAGVVVVGQHFLLLLLLLLICAHCLVFSKAAVAHSEHT